MLYVSHSFGHILQNNIFFQHFLHICVKSYIQGRTCSSSWYSVEVSYIFRFSTFTTKSMCMYGGKLSLQVLLPPFLISQRDHIILISLLAHCSLSYFNSNHTLSPTLKKLSVVCWSCLALYFPYELCISFVIVYGYSWSSQKFIQPLRHPL